MTALSDSLVFTKSVEFDPLRVNGRRIVAGYANVADVVDSQNEKLTRGALDKAWAKFSSNPKFMLSQLFHTNVPIASILLESVVDSDGVTHKSGVDERGLYIVAEVRSDLKIADDVWGQIEKGKIRGFSIGGEYMSPPTTECINGSCHKVVDDIELHEVSIVDSPANKVSLFNVLKDDSLSKLGELTSSIKDSVIVDGAVQVSKTPNAMGKFEMYINAKPLVDFKIPEGFTLVAEKCPHKEWIPLLDLALLRPYSVKGEDITGSVPGGFKDASLLDKPNNVEESTLTNVEKETKSNPDATIASVGSTQSVPPVEEKKPLTLEILAADIARLTERLSLYEPVLLASKAAKPKEGEVVDEEEDKKKPKAKKPEDEAACKCEKMEKSEAKPEAPTPPPPPPAPVPPVAPVVSSPVEVPKPVEVKVVAPTPVVEVKATVPDPAIATLQSELNEVKTIVRGIATPKQDVNVGKVDLSRLYKTPWKNLGESD